MNHNRVRLLRGGSEYFDALEELIAKAQYTIYLQVYIFDDDATGIRVGNALIEAAKRGVSVFVLADGYASQSLSRVVISSWQKAGIHFRFFEPLLRSTRFYFGRRLHHKIVVVDAQYGLVGGMNIADRYNDVGDERAWLDFAVLVEGDAAMSLFNIAVNYWASGIHFSRRQAAIIHAPTFHIPEHERCSVRIRRNDWVKGHHEIWNTYFSLFNKAQESITIMCAYFLPGKVLRQRLTMATKRGVRVRVILAGPSDVRIAKYAERNLYEWMLRHHIEIYEYQPTVLHAKMAVVDRHWVTIGSFNVNNISSYASLEVNADIRNRQFAGQVQDMMDEIMLLDCVRITRENFATSSNVFKRMMHRGAYELIRIILNLSTFYFKRE